MHQFRSHQVVGAAHVAAFAGQMLFGELKAWRTYQGSWLMAKGGGKRSAGTGSGKGGSRSGGGNPFGDVGGNWPSKTGGNWPSKTGRPSGKGRGNNPPGGGS